MFFKNCKCIYNGLKGGKINEITATIAPMKKCLSYMSQSGGESIILDDIAKHQTILQNHIDVYKKIIAFLKILQDEIVKLSQTTKEKKLDELDKIIENMVQILNTRVGELQTTPAI